VIRNRRVPLGTEGDQRLQAALDNLGAASVRVSSLDPVTTELVRLRCARHHDCRVCQSGRLGVARRAGLDETMAAKVDYYWASDLEEKHKVALRFADALMTRPEDIETTLKDELHDHFNAKELQDIAVLVMKFNHQKIHVALGTDEASASLVEFDFAEDGHLDPSTLKRLSREDRMANVLAGTTPPT